LEPGDALTLSNSGHAERSHPTKKKKKKEKNKKTKPKQKLKMLHPTSTSSIVSCFYNRLLYKSFFFEKAEPNFCFSSICIRWMHKMIFFTAAGYAAMNQCANPTASWG
jgi:hypothetical protein